MKKYAFGILACHSLDHFSISWAPGGTFMGFGPCKDCAFAVRKSNEGAKWEEEKEVRKQD